MKIKNISSFIAIISMGLLAGHSAAMVTLLGPAMVKLDSASFVELNTIAEPTFAAIFPYFFAVLIASLLTWWLSLLRNWKSFEFLMLNLGLLCFFDQLYVTYRAQVPLNSIMTSWKTTQLLPDNWLLLRQEWLDMMNVHLALSLACFTLLLVAHHHRHRL